MKKIISAIVAVGIITTLTISAFAAERHNTPDSNVPDEAKPALTEISEGLDPLATAEDHLDKEDANYRGVRLVEDGGEYLSDIGEGLSATDTVKDPIGNLVPPARQ
ncbi:hypothetical protein [Diplocloster agilis]|mgnify:CR=1 FL=1|uniref:Secreted protein n=1 Tax=Diplocloster agilis TaxID=2850323 RepID=A0A949K3G9_9FIRM|nr:hypothetical protein [Diplocloster agilis]MBU9735951.1 hypothetical protein [Diplocloster agilis]MBU9745412.1 hypothetical protein [Diplocloster agilis]